jgi:hypothetical protein
MFPQNLLSFRHGFSSRAVPRHPLLRIAGGRPPIPRSALRRIGQARSFNSGVVNSLTTYMEYRGRIMRRRDLLAAGFPDSAIRAAVSSGQIFRVRHGWYALPGTSDSVTRVIRVGGRLTGLAALRTMGMFLPPPSVTDVVVPRGAAGLRQPDNSRVRLGAGSGLRINWIDPPRGRRVPWDWIASEDEALACVLIHESREVAVACCDALVRYRGWTRPRLERVFAQAPLRVQSWLADVDGRADAHGETIVRIRVRDAGLPFEPQAYVPAWAIWTERLDHDCSLRSMVSSMRRSGPGLVPVLSRTTTTATS